MNEASELSDTDWVEVGVVHGGGRPQVAPTKRCAARSLRRGGSRPLPHRKGLGVASHRQEPPPNQYELLDLGVALRDQGKHAEALLLFERAVQLDPESADAWANLGRARNETDQHGADLDAYERALALDDTRARVWINRGIALNGLGRHEEALASCEHALALDPSLWVGWYNTGQSLDYLGRAEEALAAFEHALDIDPEDALPGSTWALR